jgi:hypothetical protein
VTRRSDDVEEIFGCFGDRRTAVVFVLVFAIALFILGLLTAKVLWWAALILAAVWVVGMISRRTRSSTA